jgi:hypothetical protein
MAHVLSSSLDDWEARVEVGTDAARKEAEIFIVSFSSSLHSSKEAEQRKIRPTT